MSKEGATRRFLRNRATGKVHRADCNRISASTNFVVSWLWADDAVKVRGIDYLREICAGFHYEECGHCLPLTGEDTK